MAFSRANRREAVLLDLVTRAWVCWLVVLGLIGAPLSSSGARADRTHRVLSRVLGLSGFSPALIVADDATIERNASAQQPPQVRRQRAQR